MAHPTLLMGLGYFEGCVHDYIRHGTTTLFNGGPGYQISGREILTTWVLVDADGDGNFKADTDMAIALLGNVIQQVGWPDGADFI